MVGKTELEWLLSRADKYLDEAVEYATKYMQTKNKIDFGNANYALGGYYSIVGILDELGMKTDNWDYFVRLDGGTEKTHLVLHALYDAT